MITIPAMHPCPALHIDADVPELRLIAHALTLIHQQGLTNPLCLQHELMLGDGPECDAANKAFARAMSDAGHDILVDLTSDEFNYNCLAKRRLDKQLEDQK